MDQQQYEVERMIAATAAAIRTHGFQKIAVGSGHCTMPDCECVPDVRPWAYTIGLSSLGHPELLSFGLGSQDCAPLLDWIADEYLRGHKLAVGRDERLVFRGVHLRLVAVPEQSIDRTQAVMTQWYNHFERRGPVASPEVLQVVVADHHGVFPWEPTYDSSRRYAQPVLADRPDALHSEPAPLLRRRHSRTNRPPNRRR